MLMVETTARTRREHLGKGVPTKQIARELRLSRNTVRKVVRSDSADVVLNVLARRRDPHPKAPQSIETLENLRLRHPPRADCQRYDRLRELGHGAP